MPGAMLRAGDTAKHKTAPVSSVRDPIAWVGDGQVTRAPSQTCRLQGHLLGGRDAKVRPKG